MSDSYLDKVYDLTTPEETQAFYDAWAETYDQELLSNGYATPLRIARALAAQVHDMNAAVLDFGCGTGLSGGALIQTGFTLIDGADLSADMLAEAREKGVYRDTWQVQPGADLPFEPGKYAAITASGVIGLGAAPPETLPLLIRHLAPGGLLAFSLNDRAFADPAFSGALRDLLDAGTAETLFQEHGLHLPQRDISATVIVLERQ